MNRRNDKLSYSGVLVHQEAVSLNKDRVFYNHGYFGVRYCAPSYGLSQMRHHFCKHGLYYYSCSYSWFLILGLFVVFYNNGFIFSIL